MTDVIVRLLNRLSPARTLALAFVIGAAAFVSTADLQAQTCTSQCPGLSCWSVFPATCGNCGEYQTTEGVYNAGNKCPSCASGYCIARDKFNPDYCINCDYSDWVNCLLCLP